MATMEKDPIPVPFPPPAAVDDVDSTLGKEDVHTHLSLRLALHARIAVKHKHVSRV